MRQSHALIRQIHALPLLLVPLLLLLPLLSILSLPLLLQLFDERSVRFLVIALGQVFQESVDVVVGLVSIEERGEEDGALPSGDLDAVVEDECVGLLGYGEDILVGDDDYRLAEEQVLGVEVRVET